jgi:hypothetical protein
VLQRGTQANNSTFFRLGGDRVLHNVQSLIFRSPMEHSTARFATSSPRVCLTALLNALLLPRRSCSFRPRFHMPLLHFGPSCRSFMTAARRPCRKGTTVNRPGAAANFCRDPPSSCVRFFGRPRRFTARRRSLDRSSVAPIVSWRVVPLESSG